MRNKTIEKNGRTLRVYEDGRIYREGFTIVYSSGRSRNFEGSFMKQYVGLKGYCQFSLRNKSSKKIYTVHRIVAEAFLNDFSKSLEVDHIDGNKSNNNVNNLRMLTKAENSRAFRKKAKNCTSKYLGVCLDKRPRIKNKKWYSKIELKGKSYFLGYHKTEEEAALAYNKKAKKLRFPPERINVIEK
jgi:hypothetical protein